MKITRTSDLGISVLKLTFRSSEEYNLMWDAIKLLQLRHWGTWKAIPEANQIYATLIIPFSSIKEKRTKLTILYKFLGKLQ